MAVDLVERAERDAGTLTGWGRTESFMNTYANSESSINFLDGDAGHDFTYYNSSKLPYARDSLVEFAKDQQNERLRRSRIAPPICNQPVLQRDLDGYSSSKGESIYLDFLKDVRGDSRLTLMGTYNLRVPADMAALLGICNNYVIDATFGNPFKNATNAITVWDLITGKTDAGSGLGPNAVGRARYVTETEDFAIPNYFYGVPLVFSARGGVPSMIMDCNSLDLGNRKMVLPKGASVNALCEAIGLPGIRNEGNAGSKIRLQVLGAPPTPHPIDFLFKTGTDFGTLLQSIYKEDELSTQADTDIIVGTLTNDRFFKERAGEFERQVILFTPDARSHTAQLWSSSRQADLTNDEMAEIRGIIDAYDGSDPAAYGIIARITAEISKAANGSCITPFIRSELESITSAYQAEKQKYLAQDIDENHFRNLLASTVEDLLKLFLIDKLVKLQDEILQFKTTISNAFGRFKSANTDELSNSKRRTIFKIIKNSIQRISVASDNDALVAQILASLSSNFVGTYGTIGNGQGVLTSTSVPTATRFVCDMMKDYEPTYVRLFTGPRSVSTVPQDTSYVKVINIVSKMIDNALGPAPQMGGARKTRRSKRGSRRNQRGGNLTETYPRCLLETEASDPRNFYPAEDNGGIRAPINDVDTLFTLTGTFNVLIFTHAVLYALIEDFHGNNTGALVESALMNLGVLIADATITDAELLTHIRFLLYDYDAIIPTLISRLSIPQLETLANPAFLSVNRIEAARADPDTTRYFSLIHQGTPFGRYELEPWKLFVLGVMQDVEGGLVRNPASTIAGPAAAIAADIDERIRLDYEYYVAVENASRALQENNNIETNAEPRINYVLTGQTKKRAPNNGPLVERKVLRPFERLAAPIHATGGARKTRRKRRQ